MATASDHPARPPADPHQPYIAGFVFALILTGIPFGLVVAELLPRFPTLVVIAILAVVQVVVHLRFFLHIDLKETPRENLLALAFAAVLIFIMVGGTLWIMLDLERPHDGGRVRGFFRPRGPRRRGGRTWPGPPSLPFGAARRSSATSDVLPTPY